MENSEQPITPYMMQQVGETSFRANKPNDPKEYNVPMVGLTKREYFAGLAMQSYFGGEFTGQSGMSHKVIAETCILMADELLKQLEIIK